MPVRDAVVTMSFVDNAALDGSDVQSGHDANEVRGGSPGQRNSSRWFKRRGAPAIVAVTDTAGRLSHTAKPTRSHAIEFATGQRTPMSGGLDNTEAATTVGGAGPELPDGDPDPTVAITIAAVARAARASAQ
jgi:hypothetical protein